MALLKGKLFAGALFAGLLVGGAGEGVTPEVPESYGPSSGKIREVHNWESIDALFKQPTSKAPLAEILAEDEIIMSVILTVITEGII